MPAPVRIRAEDLRRHVIASQRFSSRHRRAAPADVLACLRNLRTIQLDSISTVERSHLLVLASRAGATTPRTVADLMRKGRVFEYWAHEASLLPAEDLPLFRHRMRERRHHQWWGPVIAGDPALARRVMREVREHGPIRANHFEGRSEGMWQLKPEKRMLDALWTAGKLAIAGRDGFVRRCDLPERVLPPKILAAKALPRELAVRELIVRAVGSRGALTERGIADHDRLASARDLRPAIHGLVRAKRLQRADVDDGGAPAMLEPDADPSSAPEPRADVLLSPFDNLLWDRDFARRILGFDHIIEVYKPAPQRKWGYYTMPLLSRDLFAGRADLKADRAAGVLRVRAFHREPGVSADRADDAFARALGRLAKDLRLALEKGLEKPRKRPPSVRSL